MRRTLTAHTTALVALAFVTACGGEGMDEAVDAPMADAAETTTAAATPAEAQLSDQCFLARGTPAEAMNRTSPKSSMEFTLGGETATLCWGAPSARGRTIFGELEAYGTPWRAGADEATMIHLPFGGDIGGVEVEPGSYSIYMIPGEESFEIVVNSSFERWGIPIDGDVRANDVGSFTRDVAETDEPVETLTYSFESHGENMGHIVMEWQNTRVEFPVHRGMM